jgi:glycosyltransferase involved in cell wall biosynthesis
MRILLIGNFAPDRQESMLRYGKLLAAGYRKAGHEVSVWSPEPRLVRLLPRYRYGGPAKFVGYVDKFILFPRRVRERLRREAADVVHILDHANAVYAPIFQGRALVATCHDLLQIQAARGEFAQHRVSAMGQRYQTWILNHIARLPHVITPSRQTADTLQRLTPLPSENITVIPNGLNYPYRRSAPAAAALVVSRMVRERSLPDATLDNLSQGFLLNVGGGQWYKNRRGLLDMFAEIRRRVVPAPVLVMVGKPLSSELTEHAARLGLSPYLIVVSGVSETQLQALYSLAKALIFPSWHEGFGWPVAEAQACGCPVFTSNRAPMTEVGGAGADYIDPGDPAAAGRQIAQAWPSLPDLADRARLRAPEWRQELMIDRYLSAYVAVAAHRGETLVA